MYHNKIQIILQYILAVASQQDWDKRELGPIHLIKYVYLADLEYAKINEGKTFTGIKWQFYNFGPWSLEVFNQIDPALKMIGAEKKTISSLKYDFERWTLRDHEKSETILSNYRNQLPWSVTTAI